MHPIGRRASGMVDVGDEPVAPEPRTAPPRFNARLLDEGGRHGTDSPGGAASDDGSHAPHSRSLASTPGQMPVGWRTIPTTHPIHLLGARLAPDWPVEPGWSQSFQALTSALFARGRASRFAVMPAVAHVEVPKAQTVIGVFDRGRARGDGDSVRASEVRTAARPAPTYRHTVGSDTNPARAVSRDNNPTPALAVTCACKCFLRLTRGGHCIPIRPRLRLPRDRRARRLRAVR